MLTISNIYGHGFDKPQFSKLEAFGFRMRPEVSTYMGSQLCHFIDFESGPALEFIEVEDHQAYLDFVFEGMKAYCPGISFVLAESSTKTVGDFEREFHDLEPYLLHVNYDSSQTPAAPGWNYLNFKIPVVADTFVWLTAFDQPRPVRHFETTHPNGVTGVIGLVFDLDCVDLDVLARLLKTDFSGGALQAGGVSIRAKDALPPLVAKTFPLKAIVLRAKNLDFFAASAVRASSFMAHPAVHIHTNPLAWDLLIVEG
jgi:hypothetical protein